MEFEVGDTVSYQYTDGKTYKGTVFDIYKGCVVVDFDIFGDGSGFMRKNFSPDEMHRLTIIQRSKKETKKTIDEYSLSLNIQELGFLDVMLKRYNWEIQPSPLFLSILKKRIKIFEEMDSDYPLGRLSKSVYENMKATIEEWDFKAGSLEFYWKGKSISQLDGFELMDAHKFLRESDFFPKRMEYMFTIERLLRNLGYQYNFKTDFWERS